MRMTSCIALGLALALTACAHAAQPRVTLHGKRFDVELATDEPSREQGLMFRTSMMPGHGMLFVFPDTQTRSFWMKNTLIPLDILFFGQDKRLISLQRNVPPCKNDPCPTYASNGQARYVLELNGGTADEDGIEIGDALSIHADLPPVH